MQIIMPDQMFPTQPTITMIVGTPGSFKSSIAMTAMNAIHLDGDRGGKRAIRSCPSTVITSWDEVREGELDGTFKKFSTIIIDTPKSVIDDFMWAWSQRKQYFSDDRKVYGKVGEEFKRFVAECRAEGMDIIIVAHEKSKEVNDKVVYEPDITGQSKQLLIRMCDQIGFMEKREIRDANNKMVIQTVLTFNPTPTWPFCKNTGRLEDIVIPHFSSNEWPGFFDNKVVQPTKDAINSLDEEQKSALQLIEDWRKQIDEIAPTEDHAATDDLLKRASAAVAKITPEHMKAQIRAYLVAHVAAIGWQWVGTEKVFKPIAVVAPPVEEKKDKTLPVVQPAEEKPPVESEQAPLQVEEPPADEIDLKAEAEAQRADLANATTPQINKNSHLAPPKNDLFAPAQEGGK